MKSAWKVLGFLKTAILAAAALLSIRLREAYPLAIFMAGILAMNAAGLSWGRRAGKRLGLGRGMSAVLTILRGSSWWGPILAAGGLPAAGRDPAANGVRDGKRENRE